MGLFSVRPKSPSDIEQRIWYAHEITEAGRYGDVEYIPSAEGRTTFAPGHFRLFIDEGHFMFTKKLRANGKILPKGALSDIVFNPVQQRAFDTGVALVHLRTSYDPFDDLVSRYVDTSGETFQAVTDDAAFCVKAVAQAAFEYLSGAPQPSHVIQKIEAARAEFEKKEAIEKPRGDAWMTKQLERIDREIRP